MDLETNIFAHRELELSIALSQVISLNELTLLLFKNTLTSITEHIAFLEVLF